MVVKIHKLRDWTLGQFTVCDTSYSTVRVCVCVLLFYLHLTAGFDTQHQEKYKYLWRDSLHFMSYWQIYFQHFRQETFFFLLCTSQSFLPAACVLFPLLTGMIRLWSFLQKICGTLSPVTCVAGSNLRIRIQTCSAGLLKSDEHFEEVAQRKMWANYVNQSFSSHLCEIVDIRCARQRGDDSVECLGDFFF